MRFLSLMHGACFGAALAGGSVAASPAGRSISQPIYFDAVPPAVERSDVVALSPVDAFDARKGFGWKAAPTGSFSHPEFGGVRNAALQDGVAGEDFTLGADLRPGRWTLIVFLDDGFLDAHDVVIEIDGHARPHSRRRFGISAEPEQLPLNRYRVAQFQFESTGLVEIRFRRAGAPVRLLSVQLLPMDWEEDDYTRWLRRQVDEAGRHPFRVSIDILRSELGQPLQRPNAIASAAYWKAQLDLLGEAEHWHRAGGWDNLSARTRSSMFTRYKIALGEIDSLAEHGEGDAFPLRDRALWLRTRLLYWLWLEQHHANDETAFRADIADLRRKFPHDELIAMYAGERVPVAAAVPAPEARAPSWSAAQFEALHRLRDVAHYWIDQRQIPNGEFGGKTDDDVELLRWWPALIFSGDAKTREGFRKLAEGVWFSPRLHLGYSRVARDVEHSAEFIADTVPLMALATLDPEWIARLHWSYRHMRDLWTGRNAQGDLVFKSAWIGATEILSEPPRNRDLSMNARAAKAVRYHAWLTGDERATALLHDWSLSWAKAAARTEKGKPLGLFPASLRWPDAAMNGDEPTWHLANMFWSYFDWQGDGRLYDQLLFSWLTTGDAALLAPMHQTLAFLGSNVGERTGEKTTGSPAWAAQQLLKSGEFWNVVTQWRLESGDTRFDTLLLREGPPYLRYRISGDATTMVDALDATLLDALRYNRPMRTTEVLFTDRVFVSGNKGKHDGVDLLAAMLTGCHSAQGASPYHHVVWDEAPATFTALVTATARDHVAADVFLHQADRGRIAARFLRLSPGSYRVKATSEAGTVLDRIEEIPHQRHRVVLDLPGGALVSVTVSPARAERSSSTRGP